MAMAAVSCAAHLVFLGSDRSQSLDRVCVLNEGGGFERGHVYRGLLQRGV